MEPIHAMQRLGSNAQAVAVTLQHQGYRGERDNLSRHPVALYLAAATRRPWIITGTQAIATDSCPPEIIGLPFAVGAFDRGYRAGDYPDLERRAGAEHRAGQRNDESASPARRSTPRAQRAKRAAAWLFFGYLKPQRRGRKTLARW